MTDAAMPRIMGVKKGKKMMIDATTAQRSNMKKKYEDILDVIAPNINIYMLSCTIPPDLVILHTS